MAIDPITGPQLQGLAVTEFLKGIEVGGHYSNNLSMRAAARWFQSLNKGTQLYVYTENNLLEL